MQQLIYETLEVIIHRIRLWIGIVFIRISRYSIILAGYTQILGLKIMPKVAADYFKMKVSEKQSKEKE